MNKVLLQLGWCFICLVLLNACSNRYHIKHDKAPLRAPTELEMQDAVITNEAKSVSAGRPYSVLGKRYTPMSDEKGYLMEGVASWYGRKFHGYHTSNGEIFNMFDMTAAHKTLPLPSFVKVTNLDNGKSAIVRVNDRGPFHDDRLIDLSYAAAYKLGYHLNGTAKVKVEAITLERQTPRLTYIQVAAGSQLDKIQAIAHALEQKMALDNVITLENGLYKLRLGPMESDKHAQSVLNNLRKGEFIQAFLLYSDQQL
ncbi:Endolytic peptidoglycan transglycosylase RlpA [Pseudoalteromonas holothuriae]|uniref:Endolytic peptidoglycan transglycosylase RlpA n=1 Tax=Pseudoalteromonas holothuriae TaxID=2963714 RepID=A0A9W4VUQ8_9GAMM|nr:MULTISPECIES: septal ring lytic transglycosylase RlpA family protein [unclassified Pseudoalteromonas]CAH9049498.1 Endolytic peptidoglycan transglycosylase RlpA [Pseudoalteromonas sp. CIP111854]CAH9055659.1 Endolytic peptidoglycan transglycosylase RlpA [Pseudoalteromonas sp. CIP111951]